MPLTPALHEHLVVRHEGVRGARPVPGALATSTGGSFLHFVGDLHSLDELEVSGVLRHERVADREGILELGGKDPTVLFHHKCTRLDQRRPRDPRGDERSPPLDPCADDLLICHQCES